MNLCFFICWCFWFIISYRDILRRYIMLMHSAKVRASSMLSAVLPMILVETDEENRTINCLTLKVTSGIADPIFTILFALYPGLEDLCSHQRVAVRIIFHYAAHRHIPTKTHSPSRISLLLLWHLPTQRALAMLSGALKALFLPCIVWSASNPRYKVPLDFFPTSSTKGSGRKKCRTCFTMPS